MLILCLAIGAVLMIAGAVMVRVGKKTEGPALEALRPARKKKLDDMIKELHGTVPNGEIE